MGEEVFPWLKNLPLAPEYRPTLSEFQDPIAYIYKIEKEASSFGICKIIPPLPPPPKKSVVYNLNKSLYSRSSSHTFTTCQQQIGFCPRKPCPVKKPVWQSGDRYTFQGFESKSRNFERSYLKMVGKKPPLSPLEVETLYWKATVDKPLSVEYANDIPGSAFPPNYSSSCVGSSGIGSSNVGETAWNMRWVSRAEGSLLRYMKEEIPGVTSPMVYLAMMFSWFAWHVEDHDLHSLNYLHLGAGKTWYGVPRDAAVAFEEVVRVHGYGGEVNPLVTFAVLGGKTTVMSPEVLVAAGVPCCRLVQNAGEFVVTFPRAYHSGFSHGFNCGEASNIATPEWLKFAKEAAIRRASINYPPMVSHFQLLYDLALALCSRLHAGINAAPRSSRLKDKKKGEGEVTIKDEFLRNIIENNRLLHVLGKGSSVVLIPQSSSDASVCLNLRAGSYSRVNRWNIPLDEYSKIKPKLASLCERKSIPLLDANGESPKSGFRTLDRDNQQDGVSEDDRFSQQRLFSCVTCGILAFDCAAIVQPGEPTARYLMSADCNFFNEWTVNSGFLNENSHATDAVVSRKITRRESREESVGDGLYNMPIQSTGHLTQRTQNCGEEASTLEDWGETSALGLLALAYGNSSDSDGDRSDDPPGLDYDVSIETGSPKSTRHLGNPTVHIMKQEESSCPDDDVYLDHCENSGPRGSNLMEKSHQILNGSPELVNNHRRSCRSTVSLTGCSDDSSRMHIFCLQHAVDVEERLRLVGGVHISLVCYQDYPRVEAEAKHLAEVLGMDYCWNSITFRNATSEDEKMIQSSMDSEEAIPWNGDWAVKLGINLFYSANLCWSPLYSKQMPYNSVIYKAFGRDSSNSPAKSDVFGRGSGNLKKTVAGKWCGKVWMSHRVHPFMVQKDPEDQEEEYSFHDRIEGAVSTGRTETSSIARKSTKKRKMAEAAEFIKKDIDDEREALEALLAYSRQHHQRFGELRPSKSIKRQNTDSDYQTDDSAHLSQESKPKQQARLKEGISAVSRSKFATDSLPGHDLPSDDLGEDDYPLQKIPKGKRAKLTRGEAAFTRKFEEKCYFRTNRRMVSTKQESVESEDDVSNSLDEDAAPLGQTKLRRERIRRNIHPYMEAFKQIKGQKKLSKAKKLVVSGLMKVAAECSKKQEHPGSLDDSDGEEVKGRLSRTSRKKTSKLTVECRGSKLVASKCNQTEKKPKKKENSKPPVVKRSGAKKEEDEREYPCDLEGCTMSFLTLRELNLHKKNVCPERGCGKKFFSHKYLVQHRRVHVDDRPLKCPWKGCKMTFKWAWARTEHVRVHTGERPYRCAESGCGQTFRFVSDFSRHKRKTGHSVKGKG